VEPKEISNEEERLAHQLCACAHHAHGELQKFFEREEFYNSVYAIRSRVKKISGIFEKILRKRATDSKYAVKSVTDVIGLRFITLHREDMIEVSEQLVRNILGSSQSQPNPFVLGSLDEAKLYATNSRTDPASITLSAKDALDKLLGGKLEVEIVERQAYSSFHLVARVSNSNREYPHIEAIPVEIQVRSVLEDAWGQIDHVLRYGHFKEAMEMGDRPLPGPLLDRHLTHLKSLLDAAGAYADTIRYQTVQASIGSTEPSGGMKIKSDLDEEGYARSVMEQFRVPKEFIESFAAIMGEKKKLDAEVK
jgi:ppGpp synthetase/RelA/SpoT-type nucleotidyltranferase